MNMPLIIMSIGYYTLLVLNEPYRAIILPWLSITSWAGAGPGPAPCAGPSLRGARRTAPQPLGRTLPRPRPMKGSDREQGQFNYPIGHYLIPILLNIRYLLIWTVFLYGLVAPPSHVCGWTGGRMRVFLFFGKWHAFLKKVRFSEYVVNTINIW